MKDLDYGRYIDRYLDGVMTSDEKKWFELELQGNPELQAELDLFRKINTTIADKETMELNEQLNAIHAELFEPQFESRKRSFRAIGMAVGAATLMLFGILFTKTQFNSSDNISDKYYKPLETNLNYRSASNDNISNELKLAMNFYENRDYAKAIVHFENILVTDESKVGLNLYSGISHLEIKEYAEANKRFIKVIDHKENAFYESALWYLGLSYTMTNDNEKAKEIFFALSQKDGYYKKDARKIMKQLE